MASQNIQSNLIIYISYSNFNRNMYRNHRSSVITNLSFQNYMWWLPDKTIPRGDVPDCNQGTRPTIKKMLMHISSHAGRTLNHIPRAISGAFRALLNPVSQKNNFKMATESDQRWNSDVAALREEISKAKHIVFMTGAGASAESGVPTFRGAGGFWRKWQAQVRM